MMKEHSIHLPPLCLRPPFALPLVKPCMLGEEEEEEQQEEEDE